MSAHRPLFVGPLLHLRTLPALESLAQSNLVALANEAEEVLFQRGAELIEPGEPASAFFLLVDGFVVSDTNGKVVRTGPGEALGLLQALSARPARSSARAETDGVAFRLDTDALRDICGQDFQVLLALLTYVAGQVTRNPEAHHRCIAGPVPARPVAPAKRLDRVERILALHRAPAFPSRSMDALAELAGHLGESRIRASTLLWDVDAAPEGFYLVCDGVVRLEARSGHHRTVGPGSVPGMLTTLSGERHTLRAVARTAVTLLHVVPEPFFDVLEDHFEMAFGMLGRMAVTLLDQDRRE